ncbi:MAG: cell wall hydrolase [Clostridium fessum]
MQTQQAAQEAEERERRERAVISYSDEDYSVLQKIVQAEAGVCDDRGKILVANVIINRVKNKKFPNSVKAVVYEPSQFTGTGWNDQQL